jgi:hypothetical protein
MRKMRNLIRYAFQGGEMVGHVARKADMRNANTILVAKLEGKDQLRDLDVDVSTFLGSTAQLRPWPPPQNPAEFLRGFSTIFFW